MAKQDIRRPEDETPEKKKQKKEPLVPEIQGKANTFTAGTRPPDIMLYNSGQIYASETEKTDSDAYSEIDSDLATDNLQNDIPEADLQDLN